MSGVRQLTAVAGDAAGLALATVGRAARWVSGSAEAASLITAVDTHPAVRAVVERALGPTRADTAITLANALAQGVTQGTTGLAVDVSLRIAELADARARGAAWRDSQLTPPAAGAPPEERPRPDGPIERYAPRSAMIAGACALATVAAGSGPRRATAVALSTLPRAARAGRDMFAAQLGMILTRRGGHVLDRRALQLLDRVDAVILDASALRTDPLVVSDVVAPTGPSPLSARQLLAGVIQTPVVSQFLGCTPLGPVGWGIAVAAATGSALASALPVVRERLVALPSGTGA